MKTFKKVLSIALVAAFVLVMMAACGPKSPNATTKISTLEDEKGATLKILIPGHDPKDPDAWQNKVVEEFKQLYPDVTVEFVNAEWGNWEEKMMAAYQSNDAIDVLHDGVNSNPKLALKGITQPLQHYVNMDNPNMHLETMDACFKFNGNYYVAASETSFAVIYYNKNVFADAGLEEPIELYNRGEWTWETFVRVARKLTNENEKKWGYATEFPYLFYGSNATATLKLDASGNYSLNMDDPAFVAALEFIQDGWINDGWQGWETNAMNTFQLGKAAMLGSWSILGYEQSVTAFAEYGGLTMDDYGVVPMPAGPNNPDGLNMVHSAGYAIGNGSDCPAHAGKLIDMLMDAHAEYQAAERAKLPAAHSALYEQMAKKQIAVNTRDSAIGGGYDLAGAVADGQSISQAIEEFKPIYQRKINEINQ